MATKDTKNTVKAGENVTLDTAANAFGGTEYTVNVKADGKVENGSTKIVSGNTVYHETRVKNDGNYVKKENRRRRQPDHTGQTGRQEYNQYYQPGKYYQQSERKAGHPGQPYQ